MPVSSPDLKAFLLATPFFGGLADASLDLLISMLVERRFDAGAAIVAEGEPGRSMFVVHAGDLVVSKLGDSGRSIRMTDLGPGDFFGEMTLIEMQNRSATVVAETETVLYELTARNLYAYYKADIHAYVIVMQNINRELCRRLRRADNRIAEVADASRDTLSDVMGTSRQIRVPAVPCPSSPRPPVATWWRRQCAARWGPHSARPVSMPDWRRTDRWWP